MSELTLPMRGVETIDTLRAENITLKIQNTSQLQELSDVKHALNMAQTRTGGMKQRIQLKKPVSSTSKQQQEPEQLLPPPVPGAAPIDAAAAAVWSQHMAEQEAAAATNTPQLVAADGSSLAAAPPVPRGALVRGAADSTNQSGGIMSSQQHQHNSQSSAGFHSTGAATSNHSITSPNALIVALESQVRNKAEELKSTIDVTHRQQEELEDLRASHAKQEKELVELRQTLELHTARGGGHEKPASQKPTASIAATTTSQAYLMQQIQFLHEEVERLENELRLVRERSADELRAVQTHNTKMMQEKEDALKHLTEERNRMKSRSPSSAGGSLPSAHRGGGLGGGEDLFTRCSMLETQLATALSEKNAINAEKYEGLAKVRKLEAIIKEKKAQEREDKKANAEVSQASEEKHASMHDAISTLAAEKAALQQEVAFLKKKYVDVNTFSSEVQCEDTTPMTFVGATQTDSGPEMLEAFCQVNTIHHFADVSGDSIQGIAFALEEKCAELDTARSDLERLATVHTETLDYLEMTKKRLGDEMNQRKNLQEDNEKLLLQVRSLQQQSSQQQAAIREREARVCEAEAKMQQAMNAENAHAEERRKWEEQAQATSVDMQHMVSNQNIANQQIGRLTSENDQLREQVQNLMQRESQANYSIRAKDVEMTELLHAYQKATEEVQEHINNKKSLDRECENLRAMVGNKEERIVHLSEQVANLHQREQQLSVDLQSFDFETSQLHRKLVQSESTIATQQGQMQDMQQTIAAAERVNQEMDRHSAELMKQLVIKDNELALTRNRADQIEQEHGHLMSAHRAESTRLRELEDQNARLVVKNIMGPSPNQPGTESFGATQAAAEQLQKTQKELEEVKSSLHSTTNSLREANAALQTEQKTIRSQEEQLTQLRKQIIDLEKAKSDLQELLLQQSKTLEQLSN